MAAMMKASFRSVVPLNAEARSAVINHHLYEVTEENLTSLADSTDIALDTLKAADAEIYEHALDNLDAYIDAVRASTVTD